MHERIHTGEKPYKCSYCNKKFTTSGDLNRHERMHRGEKPYKCNTCNKTFTYSSSLNKHERIHKGEKPYKCSYCNKTFTESGQLKNHERIHRGEKPYKCSFCNKTFTESGNLTSHERIHRGEKPHKCTHEGCTFASAISGNLKSHIQRNHTKEGILKGKRKEQALATFLENRGFEFKREHDVRFDCIDGTFARLDFLLQLRLKANNTAFLVALENDEGAHKNRPTSCELKRMTDVHTSLMLEGNTLPLVWVRFNCDAFTLDGDRKRVLRRDRFRALANFLRNLEMTKEAHPPMSVHYLYYDSWTGKDSKKHELELFADPDYSSEFRELVTVHLAYELQYEEETEMDSESDDHDIESESESEEEDEDDSSDDENVHEEEQEDNNSNKQKKRRVDAPDFPGL